MEINKVCWIMKFEDGEILVPFNCKNCGKCCKILMNNCKFLDKNNLCKKQDKKPHNCMSFPLACDCGVSVAKEIKCEGIKEWEKIYYRLRKSNKFLTSTSEIIKYEK